MGPQSSPRRLPTTTSRRSRRQSLRAQSTRASWATLTSSSSPQISRATRARPSLMRALASCSLLRSSSLCLGTTTSGATRTVWSSSPCTSTPLDTECAVLVGSFQSFVILLGRCGAYILIASAETEIVTFTIPLLALKSIVAHVCLVVYFVGNIIPQFILLVDF